MSDADKHVARGLQSKPMIAGERHARLGYLMAHVTDRHKREEGELMACPVPTVTIGSVGMSGLETMRQLYTIFATLQAQGVDMPVRAILHLKALKEATLEIQGREKGEGAWGPLGRFKFEPFGGQDLETELDRVLEYAKANDFLLVDFLDTGNGLGLRGQYRKRHQKVGERRFWYLLELVTPALPETK